MLTNYEYKNINKITKEEWIVSYKKALPKFRRKYLEVHPALVRRVAHYEKELANQKETVSKQDPVSKLDMDDLKFLEKHVEMCKSKVTFVEKMATEAHRIPTVNDSTPDIIDRLDWLRDKTDGFHGMWTTWELYSY